MYFQEVTFTHNDLEQSKTDFGAEKSFFTATK